MLLRGGLQMPYKILVVDDEADIREILEHILLRSGYEIDTAADGQIAFEKIQIQKPDLVITDIRMPHCNGYELLKKISTLTPPRIPVLFVSGYTDGHENYTNNDPNFVGVLSKPVSTKDLLATVKNIQLL